MEIFAWIYHSILSPLWLSLPGHELVNIFLLNIVYDLSNFSMSETLWTFAICQIIGSYLLGWVVSHLKPLYQGPTDIIPDTHRGGKLTTVAFFTPHALVALPLIWHIIRLSLMGPKAWRGKLGKCIVAALFIYGHFGASYIYFNIGDTNEILLAWLQAGL
ncbi:hypothetical protein [Desulfohalobium retbaense]|uniref:Uncharacterized protein n=1 Tax=Desulfohalobium retbaense (strain ATCC 49708 / DSM 5692 / JCM 16813 / HR100) TaxID=485915 RepID=C8X5X0_DESRD|nr:hypothetical protein [Desulfohalobium retbaense]ACV69817.1 hypothetical protein Dret_2541 [Desulfohalobium retbaense DSM 5692]